MKVGIFAGNYGTWKPNGAASGPSVVALNLAKALNQHSDLEFRLHAKSATEPQQPNVERINEGHFDPSYLDQFDVLHVLSDKELALKVSDLGYAPILGTNVLFDVRHPDKLKPEDRKRLQHTIDVEAEITRREWSLSLVLNDEEKGQHMDRLGLPEDRVLPFPMGIDTDHFVPDPTVERDAIVCSVPRASKGGDLISKVAQNSSGEIWVMQGKDGQPYSYFGTARDYQRAKVYVAAPQWEPQGLAHMEALASGAPMIRARDKYDANDGMGYVERDPKFCGEAALVVARNVEEITKALHLLLGNQELREELGRVGRKFIMDNHTLAHTAEAYEGIVQKAVEIGYDSKTPEAVLRTGIGLRENKQYDAAIGAFNHVLSKDPRNFDANVNLGMAYRDIGNKPSATEYFRNVLDIDKDHAFAKQQLDTLRR